MDSGVDTENLNSPLVSSGLICHRTVRHVTTLPPGIWCTTSTSSIAYATQDGSRPLTTLRDTPSQTETVISCPHTAKEHSPAQSRSQFHPHPGKESPFRFLSGNAAPTSFQRLTSHHSLQNQLFPLHRPGGISKAAN